MRKNFTTPKLSRSSNDDWFIYFRYWNPETERYKTFKYREGLNRIKNLAEREAEFNGLAAARTLWLHYGWNPLTGHIPYPEILSFNPSAAFTGTSVEILGKNLLSVTRVSFGGIPAEFFQIESAERITATIGAGASGDISLESYFGRVAISGFIFSENPEIDALNMASLQRMTMRQALQYGHEQKTKDWSLKTRLDYGSMLKYVKEGSTASGVDDLPITSIKAVHCRLLLEKVIDIRELGNSGFNKYRDYLSSIMSLLERDEVITTNPVSKIEYKKEIRERAYKEPTEDQCRIIIPRIKAEDWDYYRFLAVCFGCAIRPKEVTRLRIQDFHKHDQIFRLDPRQDGGSKTLQFRDVAIPDWVMELLSQLNLHVYKPDEYIFSGGRGCVPFTPGPIRMNSNHPTTRWRQIVKEGLGMDVDQYGMKKRAGKIMVQLMYEKGLDQLIKLPQMQMGHANPEMTEVYTQEHKRIMQELIKREMPSL